MMRGVPTCRISGMSRAAAAAGRRSLSRRNGSHATVLCLLLTIATTAIAGAPAHLPPPADLLDKVGIEQKLGAQIPMDTAFRDATGAIVRMRDLFDDKPILLVPGYYSCGNICSVVRTGVAKAVAGSGLLPGKQFNVVLVSIDPHDSAAIAAKTRDTDAALHADAHVARWHYLTGTRAASETLMQAIGFRYFYDPRNGQYDHDAGIVVLTPQGKVAQYLFGVQFAPQTLRLSLVGASHGKIGNIVDHFLLLCCDYDPSTGRYSLVIHRIMQVLGIVTALTLLALILVLRRSESHRRKGEVPI